MSKITAKPKLTFVVGPTASGKSAWAMHEAIRLNGEIVNADSVQIYKGLDIGAAKPSNDDRKKVPHHLFDLVEPNETFTAGDYRRAALKVITERAVTTPLFIVGGSGFYLQALENGMFDVGPVSPEIAKKVDSWAQTGEVFEQLKKVDPASAQKINSNDHYRLGRALAVSLSEGRPFSKLQREFESDSRHKLNTEYEIVKIGFAPDRGELRKRVEARTAGMLKAGFINEVKSLLARGYGESKALGSVGYKECVDFLAGRLKQEDLAAAIVTSTMQLAKRQLTWFKRDREIKWN